MYLLIGALHAIPVFIVGHFTCNRFAIISVAALCAAIGFATGNPAYIGIDLICVIGATVAVLDGTSQQRRIHVEQKRVAREAKETARRAAFAARDSGDSGGLTTALLVIGLVLAVIVGMAASQQPAPKATAVAAAPQPQPVSSPPAQMRATAVSAAPASDAREAAERDAEDKWEKMLAEEDAERNRRFNELNQSLPPSFERKMADCDRRTDEIEAWVCRERFLDRLRKSGIEASQAALDGLMWPDSPQPAPTQAPAAPVPAEARAESPRSTFFTPDTRRTRHNGQRIGEAPKEISDAKECQRLFDETVKATCLLHFR